MAITYKKLFHLLIDKGMTNAELMEKGVKEHTRSREYASHIMEAVVTDKAYQIGGNVLNTNHLTFPKSTRKLNDLSLFISLCDSI